MAGSTPVRRFYETPQPRVRSKGLPGLRGRLRPGSPSERCRFAIHFQAWTSSTPTRHSAAYTWRSGMLNRRAAPSTSGSPPAPSLGRGGRDGVGVAHHPQGRGGRHGGHFVVESCGHDRLLAEKFQRGLRGLTCPVPGLVPIFGERLAGKGFRVGDGSAERVAPETGSGRNTVRTSVRTVTGTHVSLTSSRSRRMRGRMRSTRSMRSRTRRSSAIRTPLVRALTPHDVSWPERQSEPEATWAQPLSREELS